MLSVHEIFASIQGESSFAGLPCAFVRLSGCNLRCRFCDTPEAREGGGELLSIEDIVARVAALGLPLVEITGGEPLIQEGTPALVQALLDRDLAVLVETNGSLDISALPLGCRAIMDVKTPGSGEGKCFDSENLSRLRAGDEVKFVIEDETDYDYAKSWLHFFDPVVNPALLSPVFGKLDPRLAAEWILRDKLPFRLNLQLHKYIWGPEAKGV